MELPRLSKSVRKVVKLDRAEDGTLVPTVIYKESDGKKKVSSVLRPLEKGIRRIARAQATMAGNYLGKHNRSSQKRRNGWITDFAFNLASAGNKGRKTLTKSCIMPAPLKIY